MKPPTRVRQILPLTALAVSLACGSNPDPSKPASVSSFQALKTAITTGESTSLTAVFANGSGKVDPGATTVTSGTALTISPATTTTYTLTVTGATGAPATATTTVTVAPKPSLPVLDAPMMAVPATSTTVFAAAQAGVTFTWTITGVNSGNTVTFDSTGTGTATGASVSFTGAAEGSFTLSCTAANALGVTTAAASTEIKLQKNFRSYVTNDLSNILFKGITKMEAMDYVSTVGTTSLWSYPFYFVDKGRPDQNTSVIGAAYYGKGRVILAGTDGVFWDASGPDAGGPGPNQQLFANMVTWLTQGSALKYASATAENPLLMLLDNSAEGPDSGPAWTPAPGLHIKPVSVTAFDATNLDPAKYPLVYADFFRVDDAQAEALIDYVKRGGSVYAGMKGWVTTQYPWDKLIAKLGRNPRITDYPLHKAMARMGLVLADEWLNVEESSTLPTAAPIGCRARHTGWIVSSLKDVEDWNIRTTDIAQCGNLSFNEALTALTGNISHVMKDVPPTDPWGQALMKDINERIEDGKVHLKWPLSKTVPPYTMQGLTVLWNAATLDPAGTKSMAADTFPGKVGAAEAAVAQTFTVDFNTRNLAPLLLRCDPHTWNTTGLYAPAGTAITLTVTPNGTGDMPRLSVQVGCHTDELWDKDTYARVPRVALSQDLKAGENRIVSPYGGLIYLINQGSAAKTASVKIQGAVQAPYFVEGVHKNADWATTKTRQVPWTELRNHRVILSVPTASAQALTDPEALLAKWNEIIDAYDAFVGFTGDTEIHTAPNRPWHFVGDIDISVGWMHAGSPIMYYDSESSKILDMDYIMGRTPGDDYGWGFWHELGHNHQIGGFTFSQFGEVTENLFSLMVQSKYNATTRVGREPGMWVGAQAYLAQPSRNILSDGDTPGIEMVWTRLIFMWQLHLGCGDTFYPNLYRAYREMNAAGTGLGWDASDDDRAQLFAITACKVAGKDLTTFFDAWGLPMTADTRATIHALGFSEPAKHLWTIQPK